MTSEFIYSIRNIFGKSPDSLFGVTGLNQYYIGPYQRSYKWGSDGEFDQVPQLLSDVYSSMTNGDSEYFLQYITVKLDKTKRRIEVIDGQQRLTTLSLIFYCYSLLKGADNLAHDCVCYSRYSDGNVFDDVISHVSTVDEDKDPKLDSQDFYYLVRAARFILERLKAYDEESTLADFIRHLEDRVMIIVNTENSFVPSEEIFANLNDNRVPLTDAYLIKGLIITNAVKRIDRHGRTVEYSEICEYRKNMGREWDEILAWISVPSHSHFFFKKNHHGMEYLLELALQYHLTLKNQGTQAADCEYKYDDTNFSLFNKYNAQVTDFQSATNMMASVRHTYRKLRSLYDAEAASIYDLLGYVQFSRSEGKSHIELVRMLSMSSAGQIQYLKTLAKERIPNMKDCGGGHADCFRYKASNPRLFDLLLSFSVFLPLMEDSAYKFRFYDFVDKSWTFEHISPQQPKGSIKVIPEARTYVCSQIKTRIASLDPASDSYREQRDELLALHEAVKTGQKVETDKLEFLFDPDIDEHSLGNMALLTQSDNSANNNNPFVVKHMILLARKQKGAFMPYHTFAVFNKIFVAQENDPAFSIEKLVWRQNDVEAHIACMEKLNETILKWIDEL